MILAQRCRNRINSFKSPGETPRSLQREYPVIDYSDKFQVETYKG